MYKTSYILLLNDSGVKLEVDVFDPLQVNATHLTGRAQLVHKDLSHFQELHDFEFVFQTVDIFVAVGVTTLQHLDELFVATLHHRQETAANLKVRKMSFARKIGSISEVV